MKDYHLIKKIKISQAHFKRKGLKVSLPTYSFQKKEKGAKNVN
jgi:hypothetical protein